TRSPTSRSGIQEGTSGIGSSGRKSSWEMPAKERTTMKNKVQAFFLVMGGLVIAAGVVYGQLKKGYYSPAELGSLRQPAPVELLSDSSYQAAAYPVHVVDLTPGDGRQEVQIYCNTRGFTSFLASAVGSGLFVGKWMVPLDVEKPLSSFLNASTTEAVGNKLQCFEKAANHTSTPLYLNAGIP